MSTTFTIRLDDQSEKALQELCAATGESRSEVVREALRYEQLRVQLTTIRAELVPKAQAAGWVTDEDVFRDAS
ncbi:MAG: CopG family transcriptional regulator [Candidatus Methylomirabilota bacterium]|nr:ribbon-helix-helix protein, CopG family [Candidatus Methylomirabilis sp.]NJD67794.1 CopG family transcriptional regulator [candidate division NC10 bacterium]PWB47230.1 MAG: CopG family transcriptional regulator [candidate division NC10 bacterium]